ncbi:GNAT family N-acetyltransferase [Kineosporia sp. J2-2]|uniref:GNAT family N-acetyltransferase n=1 Tax=Kineosporia corallincola TaxID=2835133 RepID=A0ABS5TKE0_9ACTN|nr:GNAT family N-acetyltransferase [Kineosporia corallincola]MBT0771572.1 GNAT family N-acetyltransferase [Kineosporia corallincola]
MPTVRAYRPADLPALYDICVRTGDAGQDARGLFSSDDLLGDVYAAPYAVLEPRFTFVLEDDERPVGYVLGTPDTTAFVGAWTQTWLPRFRQRHPGPHEARDQDVVRAGLHPERMIRPGLEDHPAHLHIDLLPQVQGQGFGRQLISRFLAAVHEAGAPAVHLGAAAANTGAIAFYHRLGFRPLPIDEPSVVYLGRPTAP